MSQKIFNEYKGKTPLYENSSPDYFTDEMFETYKQLQLDGKLYEFNNDWMCRDRDGEEADSDYDHEAAKILGIDPDDVFYLRYLLSHNDEEFKASVEHYKGVEEEDKKKRQEKLMESIKNAPKERLQTVLDLFEKFNL